MNAADRFLLKKGFNLDGTKMNKNQLKNRFKASKKQVGLEILIAGKKEMRQLKYKRQTIIDK